MLETPRWCGPASLLSAPPLLFAAGGAPTLVAALNAAGLQAAYDRGVAVCTSLVAAQCLDGSVDVGRWCFVEGRLLEDRAALEAHLALVLAPGQAPREAHVLDRVEGERRADYLLHVPADLVWFRGHFPGAPVLPGVVQADWAIRHGRALGFAADGFRGFPRLKFKAVIRPDAVLRLSLRGRGDRRLEFAYRSAAAVHSEGSIAYAEDGDA